jgi:hypothetical protein
MVNFTEPVTSNMTCVGTIYGDVMLFDAKNSNINSEMSEYRVNIFLLAKELECDDKTTFVKYIDSIKIKLKYSDRDIHTKHNKYNNPWYDPNNHNIISSKDFTDDGIYYIYNGIFFVVAILKGVKHISKNNKKKTVVFSKEVRLLHSTKFIDYYKNPWYIKDNNNDVVNGSVKLYDRYKIQYIKKTFIVTSFISDIMILDMSIELRKSTEEFDIYKNPWYDPIDNALLPNSTLTLDNITYTYNGKNIRLIRFIKNANISNLKKRPIKKRMDFVNSISIEFNVGGDKIANCKISTNGRVQITGCSTMDQIHEVYKIIDSKFSLIAKRNVEEIHNNYSGSGIINSLSDNICVAKHILLDVTSDCIFDNLDMITLGAIKDKYNKYYEPIKKELLNITLMSIAISKIIFSHNISAQHRYTAMKMCHFKSPDTIEIDQVKMFKYIKSLNRYDLNPIFGNSKNKSLQIDYITSSLGNTITYMIFRSCKINMTNVKSDDNMMEGYKFITNFITENINHFAMNNYLMNILDIIIEDSDKGIEQGSEEWLQSRKNCITASDAFKVIMDNPPFGYSLNSFIIDKAFYLRTGKSSFTGNAYTDFGHYFEPIAQQILVRHFNETKPFKSCLYETGLIISKKTPFIGASPDGILLKFREDQNIKYDEKVDIVQLRNNIIANEKEIKSNSKIKQQNIYLDVSLVEIKCPSKAFKHIEKSVLIEKPHYYWQMQQQMYVLGVNNTIFMQCLFKYYDSRDDYLMDVNRKYRGTFYLTNKKAYHPSDVLSDCPEINGVEKKYWYMEDCDLQDVFYDAKSYESYIDKFKDTMTEIQNINPIIEDPYGKPSFML